MIIDSSALIAILRAEADAPLYAAAIKAADRCRMSAATYLETGIVIDSRRNVMASRQVDEFVEEAEIAIETVSAEQAKLARDAYRDFGKGSGHPAQLNFGDCFSYALARSRREPLLFKGNDFMHTDIRSALD